MQNNQNCNKTKKLENKILALFKFFMYVYFLFIVACCFGGCTSPKSPLSVTFIDISGAMSTDHTISIKVGEEDDFKDKYIDIFVKTDSDGTVLTLFQEFATDQDKVVLNLDKDSGYISLDEYKLFNQEKEQTDSMVGYTDVLATNIVINSNQDATLTFIAKVGDKKDGKFKEIAQISKEYTLKVKKHIKN